MQYDKKLEEYGIFATNAKIEIEDNKITIKSTQIDKINFQKLQEKKIKEIDIFNSEVKYIDFTKETTIDMKFECCNFKHPIIAREHSFNNTIAFHQCIFESIVDFSKAVFKSKVYFLVSIFKAEARFMQAQFLANQSDSEIIENNFRETIFEGNASFGGVIFQGKVSFALSQFKGETKFIQAQFLANQSDSEKNKKIESNDDKIENSDIVENDFRSMNIEGNASFDGAKFQGRVSFALSQFKGETKFMQAQFLANQSDSEIIENDFRETSFKGNASFDGVIFQGKVSFVLSQFKGETKFIQAQFLANQSDSEKNKKIESNDDKIENSDIVENDFRENSDIVENDFRETSFKGNASFDGAKFQGRVSFALSQFKGETKFMQAQFLANQSDSEIIENNFRETIFEGNASFDGVIFQGKVSFIISQFKGKTKFIQAQFLANQSDSEIIENDFRETIFEGNASFGGVIFQGKVSFELSIFKAEILFVAINLDNCIFNHTEFNKTKFISIVSKNTETYTFRNSTFKDMLSFENLNISKLEFDNVVFNGIVTFDKAKLDNKPQFINCTFSNQFNIEHKNIQYNYKEIEEIKDYDSLLNYRDLFRKLKSNRIAHHNLIDASELHTQELYARELELKHKDNKTIKEHIEKWQLYFYRKLCDHHTDLLLNLKWFLYVVALYVLLLGKIHIVYPIAILAVLPVFLICCYKCKLKNIIPIMSSIIFFITICDAPQTIIGISNLFSKDLNMWQNLITTIYVIIAGLILFSIQKTARKNSIVPN